RRDRLPGRAARFVVMPRLGGGHGEHAEGSGVAQVRLGRHRQAGEVAVVLYAREAPGVELTASRARDRFAEQAAPRRVLLRARDANGVHLLNGYGLRRRISRLSPAAQTKSGSKSASIYIIHPIVGRARGR